MSLRVLALETELTQTTTNLLQKFNTLEERTDGFRCFCQLAQCSVNGFKEFVFGNAWPMKNGRPLAFLKVVSTLLGVPMPTAEE